MRLTLLIIMLMFCRSLFDTTTNLRAEDAFERISDVVYVERGDEQLLADAYIPNGDGPHPAVLMVHGGAWRIGSKRQMVGQSRLLAENGYTVFNINYRLAPKHKFPAQIDDCKAAVQFMRSNAARYKIDTHRIAGFGYSAGAHLVCLLGMCNSDKGVDVADDSPSTRLHAVVAGGTPCDFLALRPNSKTFVYWLGGTRGEKPDVYKMASPASFVTKDDPPVFFYHGTEDKLVPRDSVDRMRTLLGEAGVASKLYEVKNKGHITAFLDTTAQKRSVDFLNSIFKKETIRSE